jgi:hypothetical protein
VVGSFDGVTVADAEGGAGAVVGGSVVGGVVVGADLVVGAGVVGAGVVAGAVVGCVGVVDGGTVLTLVPVGLVLAGVALTDALAGAVVLVTAEELWTLSPVSLGWPPVVRASAMTATTAQAARPAKPAMRRFRVKKEFSPGSGPEPG